MEDDKWAALLENSLTRKEEQKVYITWWWWWWSVNINYDHWHRLVRRRLNGYSTRLTKTKVVRSPRRKQSGLAGGLLLHIKEIIHHHNISETAWWLAWRMLRLGWMLPTKTGSVSLILTFASCKKAFPAIFLPQDGSLSFEEFKFAFVGTNMINLWMQSVNFILRNHI